MGLTKIPKKKIFFELFFKKVDSFDKNRLYLNKAT